VLLPDAEAAKDVIEHLFPGGVTGDFPQTMQSGLKVSSGKLWGNFFVQSLPGFL
jgi:hypothetical protein